MAKSSYILLGILTLYAGIAGAQALLAYGGNSLRVQQRTAYHEAVNTGPTDLDAPPVAYCQDSLTVHLDADGRFDLTPDDLNDGSSDDNTAAKDLDLSLDFSGLAPNDAGKPAKLITLVVADGTGQYGTCTSWVTVRDTLAPKITCRNVTIELDPVSEIIIFTTSSSGAILSRSDNSGEVNDVNDFVLFNCGSLGDNELTLTAKDRSGNQASCDIVVTVIGITCNDDVPVANCQNAVTYIDANDNLKLDPASLNSGSTDDNTPPEDLIFSIDFGSVVLNCEDVGDPAQTITLVVIDNIGQRSTCTALVTVEGFTSPEITDPNTVAEVDENSSPPYQPLVVSDLLMRLSDNCSHAPLNKGVRQLESALYTHEVTLETFCFQGYGLTTGSQENKCAVSIQLYDFRYAYDTGPATNKVRTQSSDLVQFPEPLDPTARTIDIIYTDVRVRRSIPKARGIPTDYNSLASS